MNVWRAERGRGWGWRRDMWPAANGALVLFFLIEARNWEREMDSSEAYSVDGCDERERTEGQMGPAGIARAGRIR